ncbi:agmatinase family protein [Aquibacillus sp. 3ASR75-11]|uniref:Agmatinase family protein n=1 Tax=Terrihalobacillus insolitus TaxID=2950438 RepID=A0A9X4AKC8_9BACI|nr:agmatinase family protein [Terrihalobacillus insolitus]MDC3412150.1 agmatinase family protein [Terrihalobacillus insolitus]MDC3423157.1 agmatinase family protein [Terrihalobacillus insolitus]
MSNEKIYGNTPCFLGGKKVSFQDENIDEQDVLIYGVPWEGSVTWGDYTGCELGPKVIRLNSARYSGYLPELNHMDVLSHYKIGDLGDIDVVPADTIETMRRIENFSKKVWKTGKFPVAFGGDHGVTYPIVKALSEEVDGKVGIIHLDAHYDNHPDYEGDLYARSTPFARIYESESVRNESIVHMGIHGPRNKPETGKYADEVGATTISSREVRQSNDLVALAKRAYDIASQGTEAVYLSICSDVLDFAFNPGGPVDGNGLTSYELVELVHEFSKLGIRGMDYVEVYPQNDPNDNSSHFVSTVVLYALAGKILKEQA